MPLRSILDGFWSPTGGGKRAQDGGSERSSGGESCIFRRLVGVLVHLGAKMAPRPLQETSWDRFYRILGANLVDFWCQLGGFLIPTWWILVLINQYFK